MKHGFIKVAAVSPEVRVADCEKNAIATTEAIRRAVDAGAKIVVGPELGLTGYTCGDLFLQSALLDGARSALLSVVAGTEKLDALVFVGLPLAVDGRTYNVAAVLNRGKILAFVPKTYLPNYDEFYEKRHFFPAPKGVGKVRFEGEEYPFGTDILFRCETMPDLVVAAEICEDAWSVTTPGTRHALAGATVLVNLSASDEVVGKADFRRKLLSAYSARLVAGIVYADAGRGESTTDVVFAGHDLVYENGRLLAESKPFGDGFALTELDVKYLAHERAKLYNYDYERTEHLEIPFGLYLSETSLTRRYDKNPFVPEDKSVLDDRADLILRLQAEGLAKRIAHTGAKCVVVGVSGGLDSTLTMLVAVRAVEIANNGCRLIGVTMPCFGTTGRTYNNACRLVEELGAELREVNIKDAVTVHLKDIGHDMTPDVTYENAQARERTQVLMDISNREGGFVVGTGDLSELALGWATYNGDHMSMYGTNGSVPKTLVRHLVRYAAEKSSDRLKKTLLDVLDTPVSPELLPPKDGEIAQKTEDLVGPYELHDFFLYYTVRAGFAPEKVLRIAKTVFASDYDEETIEKWLRVFVRRFFTQQFKRSCMPDGVKVGSVDLSPRGSWRMPSDAVSRLWQF
ncbi:MAG: NAD(+) synthase [Clostridia bacterium]|nr:NAD(+) synthase [Clostridia bacterium]